MDEVIYNIPHIHGPHRRLNSRLHPTPPHHVRQLRCYPDCSILCFHSIRTLCHGGRGRFYRVRVCDHIRPGSGAILEGEAHDSLGSVSCKPLCGTHLQRVECAASGFYYVREVSTSKTRSASNRYRPDA
ncbi:hypothetical protein C8Q74DRAFT_301898 [Fomes fomentarius]|nr:hypothetical protein C8Q74DRAFT_301898 [Fomes fomentarius]